MIYNTTDLINAIEITGHTLIGAGKEYPTERGNCFSVKAENKREYRIVNFILENLEHIIKNKDVGFPIKILPLSKYVAVICDSRISEDFYRKNFCEHCTPEELLPAPQRIKQLLDIERGIRTEKITEIGKIVGYTIESKRIKTDWTWEEGEPTLIGF